MNNIYQCLAILLVGLCLTGASHAQTTISYAQASYCNNTFDPSPTITGTTGGTFSASTGLSINTTTGTIDVSNSVAGNYTITYSTTVDTATTSVEIIQQDDASFAYPDSVYCAFGFSDTPTVATAGGVFSYTPSNSNLCLNTSTGVINATNCFSDIGTYTIQYTTNGACPASSTQTVRMAENTAYFVTYPGLRSYCQNRANVFPSVVYNTVGSPVGYYSGTTGLVIDSISGEINIQATPPGVYVIDFTPLGICPYATSATITILALDDASFSYNQNSYCRFDNDPTPTITGLPNGRFSASAGMAIDSVTGAIDLSASLNGQFMIYYTTNGQCPNVDSTSIIIDTLDDAGFAYDTTRYCQNGGIVVPTITGEQGGSFSSLPFGLALNSTTGAIDLANSAAFNYTVIYTTNNPCRNFSTFNIDIDSINPFVLDYPLDNYCTNDSTTSFPIQRPVFANGTFSSDPPGLVIGYGVGEIYPWRSPPNTYVVSYVPLAVFNYCTLTYTDTITILPADTALFNYGAVRFCVTDPSITPILLNTTGGVFTANNGLTIDPVTGRIDFALSTPGNYVVTYTTAGYCSSTFSQSIQIDPFPTAGFTYGAASYCTGGANPSPAIAGISGGQFSGSAGLVVNQFSGEIDLSATPAGTYTVYYNLTTSCTASDSTTVVINAREDASFAYAKSDYCQNEPAAVPSITNLGGQFVSSPAGLSFNLATGTVDVANSVAGTYTVTYSTNGTCPDTSSQNMTINALPSAAFSYAKSNYCLSEPNPNPIITGTTGGRFFSSNLSVDILFGQIDLSTASTGTYTVSYGVGGAGCADTSSVTIVIDSSDDASFAYAKMVYCQNEPSALPTTVTTGGNFASNPSGLALTPSTGAIDFSSSSAGTYNITYTTNGNCADSSSAFVTVVPSPSAAFAFANGVYCLGAPNPSPVITGTTGGLFTATNNLALNSSTGELDLSGASVGGYTITYEVGNGSCTDSSSVSISLAAPDTASFDYTDTVVCVNGGNNVVLAANSTTSGSYSASPTGVVFANTTTGEIDVPNTTAGTYVVSYITNGLCPDTASVNLTATFCLGKEQLAQKEYYGLYPNPNTGQFYLVYEGTPKPTNLRVVNTLGQVIYEKQGVVLTTHAHAMQLPSVPAGTYWIVAENEAGIWRKPIVVAQP